MHLNLIFFCIFWYSFLGWKQNKTNLQKDALIAFCFWLYIFNNKLSTFILLIKLEADCFLPLKSCDCVALLLFIFWTVLFYPVLKICLCNYSCYTIIFFVDQIWYIVFLFYIVSTVVLTDCFMVILCENCVFVYKYIYQVYCLYCYIKFMIIFKSSL